MAISIKLLFAFLFDIFMIYKCDQTLQFKLNNKLGSQIYVKGTVKSKTNLPENGFSTQNINETLS